MKKSAIKILGSTILCTYTAQAIAAVDDHKNICLAEEKTAIASAITQSKNEVQKAISLLEVADSVTLSIFERWFGENTEGARNDVLSILSKIHLFSGFQNNWCVRPSSKPFPDEFDWAVGDLAGVHPSSSIDMFFAPDYFSLAAIGVDSMSSTIIHENAHQVGAGYVPEVYDVDDIENLAKVNGTFARRHAQSIEYFVTDLIYGI